MCIIRRATRPRVPRPYAELCNSRAYALLCSSNLYAGICVSMYMHTYAIVVYADLCGTYAYLEHMHTYASLCKHMIYACLCKFLCMFMQMSYASLCSKHSMRIYAFVCSRKLGENVGQIRGKCGVIPHPHTDSALLTRLPFHSRKRAERFASVLVNASNF